LARWTVWLSIGRELAVVEELAEAALRHEPGKDGVRLGADEVVRGDGHGIAGGCWLGGLCLCEFPGGYGEQQQSGADANAKTIHGFLLIHCSAIRSMSGNTHCLSKNGFSGP
jgi:hypothetical protein